MNNITMGFLEKYWKCVEIREGIFELLVNGHIFETTSKEQYLLCNKNLRCRVLRNGQKPSYVMILHNNNYEILDMMIWNTDE